MDFKEFKITDEEINSLNVKSAADSYNNDDPQANKDIFDRLSERIAEKHNMLVDIMEGYADYALNSGSGDMQKFIYDINGDGVVNKADNGFFTYSHSKVDNVHYLNGSGDNIKFTATADFDDGDVFMVDGEDYTAFLANGDALPGGHFKAGYVVSCFKNGNCLNFNNGGAALNFKVVGSTTEPASPEENTIWVNTDTEITGWTLAANQPDYLADGGVWIEIATAGSTLFNALKKNGLYIAPKKAWQYNGGSFDEKDMLVYINGEWIKTEEILFPYGLEFETGGENKSECKVEDLLLHCEAKSTSTNGNCHSLIAINCSKYSKLIFTVGSVSLSGNATATVGVHYSGWGTTSGGYGAFADVTARGVYEVDLTNVNEYQYVTVSVWTSDAEAEMTVTGITVM